MFVRSIFLILAFTFHSFLAAPARAGDQAVEDCTESNSGSTNWDRQIAGCNQYLARGPALSARNRAIAYAMRGFAYKNKREFDRALADLDKAIRLNPKFPWPRLTRGLLYNSKGVYDRAIADFNDAIRLSPKYASAYVGRGAAYHDKGDYDRAIADFDEAIGLDPKDSFAYIRRGNAYLHKDDYDRAIANYDEAIRLDPKNALAYTLRGIIYGVKGDYDRAIRDYDEAIRFDPNDADVYSYRANAYLHKEDYARAIRDYDEAIHLNPNLDKARTARDEAKRALATVQLEPPIPAAAPPSAVPSITAVQPVTLPAARLSETRVALVIGNANYAAQSPLKNPSNDAKAIAGALHGAGFKKVEVAENLSRDALVTSLQAFQDEADRADWAVIYFSGHGVEIGGVNYVVPTDARLLTDRNAPDEAVSLDRLMASVGGAHKLRIVILDACRDNPFVASMRRTIASRSAGKGLAPVEPTRATLVVYAARDGQLAQDGAGDNSPFAAALAKRLGEPHVEVSKLFRLVTDDVLDATGRAQQPFVYGSLPGREDFYFRP